MFVILHVPIKYITKRRIIEGRSLIEYYESGFIRIIERYKRGESHRDIGPARITYYDNGKIHEIEWHRNGLLSRNSGPAIVTYYENDIIQSESWYIYGNENRLGGPAVISYHENGNIYIEAWYMNELRNVSLYTKNGVIINKLCFIDGLLVDNK
jgi:antitoxin component YwqK of YwqJK toxin-antitoxin module